MTKLVPVNSQPITEAAHRKLGRQLTDQYRKATKGMTEYIAFGALAQNVQVLVDSARGANSELLAAHAQSKGRFQPGTGLKGWLELYSPEINERTAYRYIELAEGVRAEFRLGEKADLYQILKAAKPDTKQLALRDDIKDFVQGKSQRQLLVGFGKFEGKAKSTRKKPPTEEERREAWLEDARQRSLATFSGLHDLEERWKTLTEAEVKVALEDAKAFVREADAWLKTPAPSRAALRVDKFLEAADAADRGGNK